jgi:hypothetical protein
MKALTLFASNFDGTGKALPVFKFEGKERMGDLGFVGFEVFEDEPYFADLVQAHFAFNPSFIEVLGASPSEITDVFEPNRVSIEVSPR